MSTTADHEGLKPNGPAAAVLLASGIGTFVLGLLTTLNEASTDVNEFLAFTDDVGPLSGKTIIAAGAFFAAWGILGLCGASETSPGDPLSSQRSFSWRSGSSAPSRHSSRRSPTISHAERTPEAAAAQSRSP